MITLGAVLLLLGWLLGINTLYTLGVILLAIGLALLLLGQTGHPIGGRRWYF